MRPGPANGAARARARGGVAPALLLDVQTPSGAVYYFADRKLVGIPTAITDTRAAALTSIAMDAEGNLVELVFAIPSPFTDGLNITLAAIATTVTGNGDPTEFNGHTGSIYFPDEADRTTVFFTPDSWVGIDRSTALNAIAVTGTATINPPAPVYQPWLVSTGTLSFNRSLQTDTGSLALQNVSGDVLQRDFERIARRSTLEGSLYVFRYYAVDLGFAWIEQHGTLTVGDTSTTAPLSLVQLLAGSDDTPNQEYTETCQLQWGAGRCPATGNVECLYTYASCQVIERFTGIQTAFETNNPEAAANPPLLVINRKKAW